ncbi:MULTISPECIES: hypothetical protein [unclassified Microbispora]|uniref:hypothetical protein n=1 Tax=unclassified Microbispora TaxID=2614687 RepID=UPI0014743F9D|nr:MULTISPECIES: hypothetical protein [unclassified Microbispora]
MQRNRVLQKIVGVAAVLCLAGAVIVWIFQHSPSKAAVLAAGAMMLLIIAGSSRSKSSGPRKR